MASDPGFDVIHAWFESWNSADMDAFANLYAPDAEMTPPASWVETALLTGRPAIRQFFQGLRESWEGHDVAVLTDLFRAGEEVVSRMDWQVRGRVSGIETHLEVTNVSTIVNGEIVRQAHYLDHREALRALGLDD